MQWKLRVHCVTLTNALWLGLYLLPFFTEEVWIKIKNIWKTFIFVDAVYTARIPQLAKIQIWFPLVALKQYYQFP